ncbi:MAG: malate dehydrogenase (quinone) [Gammaproteobacteria bacterium]|jgi:malate dehydrogenase (quinone)
MTHSPTKIVLIGAGIMSATLGILLRKLLPDAQISIYERLDKVAAESSDPWNNSGTGHSAFCELNYTPYHDGKVDISKALTIAQQFEISKQLWAYLKEQEYVPYDIAFINKIPHLSFVWGDDNVAFLKERYKAMQAVAMFQDMQFSSDPEQISRWIPLMMQGRKVDTPIAATRMDAGTDINFGLITRSMIHYLQTQGNAAVNLGHEVIDFSRREGGQWHLEVKDLASDERKVIAADYIFIGAGGGTLPLLEKTEIDEAEGYGGFPISGEFLQCTNPDVIQQHNAKVYGKAAVGSPPMSVPHLDTRVIDGQRTLFFGPYAGFTTKFLKSGSYLDLPLSIEMHNVWPILSAGMNNIELTKYLIKQVTQSDEERFNELLTYYPTANVEDWKLTVAGQRVQIIKKDKDAGGVLRFGTEIVCSGDGSVAALLGASPGASTSVSIMLEVISRMFPEQSNTKSWQNTLREMIPSYGQSLIEDGELCLTTRQRTSELLQL